MRSQSNSSIVSFLPFAFFDSSLVETLETKPSRESDPPLEYGFLVYCTYTTLRLFPLPLLAPPEYDCEKKEEIEKGSTARIGMPSNPGQPGIHTHYKPITYHKIKPQSPFRVSDGTESTALLGDGGEETIIPPFRIHVLPLVRTRRDEDGERSAGRERFCLVRNEMNVCMVDARKMERKCRRN